MKADIKSYALLKAAYNKKTLDYKEFWFWRNIADANVKLLFDITSGWVTPDTPREKIFVKVLGSQIHTHYGATDWWVKVSYLKKDGTERKYKDVRLIPRKELYYRSEIL